MKSKINYIPTISPFLSQLNSQHREIINLVKELVNKLSHQKSQFLLSFLKEYQQYNRKNLLICKRNLIFLRSTSLCLLRGNLFILQTQILVQEINLNVSLINLQISWLASPKDPSVLFRIRKIPPKERKSQIYLITYNLCIIVSSPTKRIFSLT